VPHQKRLILLTDQSTRTSVAIHNNSYDNAFRALRERLVYHKGERPLKPVAPFNLVASEQVKQFEKLIPRISSQEFVEHYVGHKRKIYEKAKRSLVLKPIEHKDSWIKMFVKDEKFDYMLKPDQVPRPIQPRTPRYNLELGRFLQPMEKAIYSEIDALYGHQVVMKGKNALQRGSVLSQHWMSLKDPVAVGIDAARFDQHTGRDALKYEHNIYLRHCAPADRWYLRKLLNMQLTTYGVCYTKTGKIKYKIPGVRCSGDVNTSLGNIILMTHMVYDYLKSLKIPFRFINDGDDGVILVNREHLSKLNNLQAWFRDYGYKMETEDPVYYLEQIEFCQCKPIWDGKAYIMARNPDVVCNRDAYTTKSVATRGQWDYYRSAIATGGLRAMGGIPVVQNFYRALGKGAKEVELTDTSTGLYWMGQGLTRTFNQPNPSTRLSYFIAFDITPDTQVVMEEKYDTMVPMYEPSGVHKYLYS